MKLILIIMLIVMSSACTNRQSYVKKSGHELGETTTNFIKRYRGRNIEVYYIHDDRKHRNKKSKSE